MNKFASRKLIVSLIALVSAVVSAYTDIDPDVREHLMHTIATIVTFYLLGQGGVDIAAKMQNSPDSPG